MIIDTDNIKSISDNIVIKITNQSIDAIFSKTIITESGEKKSFSINVDADEGDDRKSTLFVETAIVVFVGKNVLGIQLNDIAIISYELINDKSKLITVSEEEGLFFSINPKTKYHKEENIAFGNRRMPAFQMAWENGEVEEISSLIGIIRDEELIANDPYVFLSEVSDKGVFENEELIQANVFSVSKLSSNTFGFDEGDLITVREPDVFEINIDDKKITCCNDSDLLCVGN